MEWGYVTRYDRCQANRSKEWWWWLSTRQHSVGQIMAQHKLYVYHKKGTRKRMKPTPDPYSAANRSEEVSLRRARVQQVASLSCQGFSQALSTDPLFFETLPTSSINPGHAIVGWMERPCFSPQTHREPQRAGAEQREHPNKPVDARNSPQSHNMTTESPRGHYSEPSFK